MAVNCNEKVKELKTDGGTKEEFGPGYLVQPPTNKQLASIDFSPKIILEAKEYGAFEIDRTRDFFVAEFQFLKSPVLSNGSYDAVAAALKKGQIRIPFDSWTPQSYIDTVVMGDFVYLQDWSGILVALKMHQKSTIHSPLLLGLPTMYFPATERTAAIQTLTNYICIALQEKYRITVTTGDQQLIINFVSEKVKP